MADNLNLIPQGFGSLHEMQYVRLIGPDAAAFAHAQFSNDVQALAVGHWQWTTWLTAKGRVIAIFALLRESDTQLLMLLPDGNAAEIAAQLGRFVFRRKLTVAVARPLAYGGFEAPRHASGARATIEARHIELDLGSTALPRTLLLLDDQLLLLDDQALNASIVRPAIDAEWRHTDLRLGLVRLPESQREQWTPQQLALDRLQAYSVKKGCYPGQEIVARTHFLGKAKRTLQLLQTDGNAEAGDAVALDGAALGTVVSVAAELALAVLPLDAVPAADATLLAGAHAAHPLDITRGLER